MANRTIGDFTRSRLVVPDLAPDMSGANLLNMVSKQAGHAANVAIETWQKAEVGKATAEGRVAGTQDNVAYRPGSTMTAQAFNTAAKNSMVDMTELRATAGMNQIANDFKNDPLGYQAESAELIANMSNKLREAGDEAGANMMEARMRLSAESKGYQIGKAFQAQQVDQMKANTQQLMQQLKTDSWADSGGVFSPDQETQGNALAKFAVNKMAYDKALHQVLPDGTPVYSAQAIQKRQEAFHSEFYTNAVQNWVSEADLSVEHINDIRTGKLEIFVPGHGNINVADEVGVDDYKKKVANFTMTKLREKDAARSKERELDKEVARQQRDANDISVLHDLYTGVPVSAASVQTMVGKGDISASTAKAAIKMINNPALTTDDIDIVTELKIRQIRGEDITEDIKLNANRISAKTNQEFADYEIAESKKIQAEDEKWIVREMVKKSGFGIEDPRSLRLASDTVDSYRQKLADGDSPELAFQSIRATMDAIKDRANRNMFNSVPKYSVISNGTIDIGATMAATGAAYDADKIDEETYQIEKERLEALKQERGGAKNE